MCRAIKQLTATHVAAVHDSLDERANALASAYGGKIHPSPEALVADPAVDVVYVGLPHHLLAPAAHAALRAGKHAMVEKPMGLDIDQIRWLEDTASANDRVLVPVFELRTSGPVREARRLLRDGALGPVQVVRIRTVIDKPDSYWQSGPRGLVANSWRAQRAEAGGGVVLMNSIHQLDVVRFLTDLSFVSAMALTATLHADVEVEDTAAAVLRLSNGGIANLVAAAHSAGAVAEERIEFDGAAGRLDLPDASGDGRASLRLYLRRPWRQLPAGEWLQLDVDRAEGYHALLNGVATAIHHGSRPPASANDAAAALATVLAIYESAETAREALVRSTAESTA